MNELVFATHNINKAKEIQQLVGDQVRIRTLDEMGFHDEIAETGQILVENAVIKSRYLFERLNINCFADDTGLEVHALNGAPGVYSARYAGEKKDDQANMDLLLHNLSGIEDRSARFVTVISLIFNGREHVFEGILNGSITMEKTGNNGFGYDPVFKPEGYDMTLAEMDLSEKNRISHRAKAFSKLQEFLRNEL